MPISARTGTLILFLASLSLVFLLGEITVRFVVSAWPFEKPLKVLGHLNEQDKNLRWRFSPGEGRNSLGLKEKEVYDKHRAVFRILFLGDSLVFSGETSSGQLYTKVIEEHLNKATPDRQKVEVLNAGIPGYTTYQELEFLKVYGLGMNPDLVVLGFVFNDVYYKYLHKPTERKLLDLEPAVRLHTFNPNTFFGSLLKSSYLAHEVMWRGRHVVGKLSGSIHYPFENRRDFYLAWKEYGWANVDRLIGEMHELLKKEGIRLAVVVFPVSDQVDHRLLSADKEYVLYPQSRIEEILIRENIPSLDLTSAIYTYGGKKLFRDYLHLSPSGNDLVATEITAFIHTLLE